MDRYSGAMPDGWFRQLAPDEEAAFRQWARDNHGPVLPEDFALYHPVVRDEWRRLDNDI